MLSTKTAGVLASLALSGLAAVTILTAQNSDPRPTVAEPAVIFVDQPCGHATAGGCYSPGTDPNVVYVDAQATAITLPYIIAHETAHFHQHRTGQPFDECAADAYALQVTENKLRYKHSAYREECQP